MKLARAPFDRGDGLDYLRDAVGFGDEAIAAVRYQLALVAHDIDPLPDWRKSEVAIQPRQLIQEFQDSATPPEALAEKELMDGLAKSAGLASDVAGEEYENLERKSTKLEWKCAKLRRDLHNRLARSIVAAEGEEQKTQARMDWLEEEFKLKMRLHDESEV